MASQRVAPRGIGMCFVHCGSPSRSRFSASFRDITHEGLWEFRRCSVCRPMRFRVCNAGQPESLCPPPPRRPASLAGPCVVAPARAQGAVVRPLRTPLGAHGTTVGVLGPRAVAALVVGRYDERCSSLGAGDGGSRQPALARGVVLAVSGGPRARARASPRLADSVFCLGAGRRSQDSGAEEARGWVRLVAPYPQHRSSSNSKVSHNRCVVSDWVSGIADFYRAAAGRGWSRRGRREARWPLLEPLVDDHFRRAFEPCLKT